MGVVLGGSMVVIQGGDTRGELDSGARVGTWL